MQAFLVLSDAASTDMDTGKVNMLGAGWSVTGPSPSMAAVAGFLRIPWDELGDKIGFILRLVNEASEEVCPFVDNDEPLRFAGAFALPAQPQPEDTVKRVPLNISFAIPLPPLPLAPGHAYRWILEIDGEEAASVDFAVRAKKE